MAGRYAIGIDVGTSALKAVIVDASGSPLASHSVPYPLTTPRPGWVEQDPDAWWQAAETALSALLADRHIAAEVAGLGLCGQMHGLVALDADQRVLRPAILWNDQRNQAQCDRLIAVAGGLDALLAQTNNTMLTGYTGGKILWLREEEPQHYAAARLFLNPKDYVRLRLTGIAATDVAEASGMGLFNVRERRWADGLLGDLGIDRSLLPPAFECAEVVGTLSNAIAARFGLPQDLPVVAGSGDAVIQTTATGVLDPGPLQVTIGTGGIVAAGLDHAAANAGGRLQVFCNNTPDRWHAMGVTLNAGGSFGWLRRLLEGIKGRSFDFDAMTALASAVPAGSEGLFFAPYVAGERCPYPDANARGSYVGFGLHHGEGHLVRAAMEGITYSLKDIIEELRPLGVSLDRIRASGGGATSLFWRQLQADIFNLPVVTVRHAEVGGALGTAYLAGVGGGLFSDLREPLTAITEETITEPNPAVAGFYAERYARFRGLYPELKQHHDSVAAFAVAPPTS